MSLLKRLYVGLRKIRAARSFRHGGARVGRDVSFGPYALLVRRSGSEGLVSIGNHVYLDCMITTVDGGRVQIGSDCWIGGAGSTAIGAVSAIKIGSNVIVSNHVHIYDHNSHPTSPAARLEMTRGEFFGPLWSWARSDSAPVTIEDNVWVGEYSYIGKGVTIGRGSIVAAHTVVTRDVPPFSVVAGNPGRVVKTLSP